MVERGEREEIFSEEERDVSLRFNIGLDNVAQRYRALCRVFGIRDCLCNKKARMRVYIIYAT